VNVAMPPNQERRGRAEEFSAAAARARNRARAG
jgi:hypothetical protein